MIRKIIRVIPHLTIVLSCMFLIFWYLDQLNPTMNFVNCSISNKLLVLFCILSVLTSVSLVWMDRKLE
ncbi:MAG: hypothetical protein Q4G58_05445 [bacterium]|nr:hypothetical protein [bacterium]